MQVSPRDVITIFKLILALVFAGMGILFWAVNRREDARRTEEMNRLDAEEARGWRPKPVTPLEQLRTDLSDALHCSEDLQTRGVLLVDVFNRLFALDDASVFRPFKMVSDQIEGVAELDEDRYLVDVRWSEQAVGVAEIQKHLARLKSDEEADANIGLFVSFCGFTEQAVQAAKKACAAGDVIVLCTLADFVHLLEGEANLRAFLSTRVQIVLVDKNPYASYSQYQTA